MLESRTKSAIGKPPDESILGVKFKKLRNLKRFGEMVVLHVERTIAIL
jgi:hypothetical protein